MQPKASTERILAGETARAIATDQGQWREVLAGGLYRAGALRLLQSLSRSFELWPDSGRRWVGWRRVSSPKFAILCYHRVGSGGVPLYSALPSEVFEAQMCFLRKHYRIVSLDTLYAELREPNGVGQSVAVTFDDGYREVYTKAFPILQKYKVPATIFATVGAIETGDVPWYDRVFLALDVASIPKLHLELDRPRSFELFSPAARYRAALETVMCLRTLPEWRRKECSADLEKQIDLPQEELAERMMTWEQIRAMHQAGIAFGSHTITHPVISRLTPAEMETELRESKRILENKIGSPVLDFAFPFGQDADCGNEAGGVLARCGYRSAATTIWGINMPGVDCYRLRRVQIGEERSLAMFALRLNELFLRADAGDSRPASSPSSSVANEALCGSGRSAS